MFDWYSNAGICYAYLLDIDHKNGASFMTSRWWTRAWTLQELLASKSVEFYDSQWRCIGSKSEHAAEISLWTGIDEGTLRDPRNMFFKSIAQRMSWAAGREAKRHEDRAYSLLGIFEISMSMQYGEGSRAFMRLQEEILKSNNDQTLFAWSFSPREVPEILQARSTRLKPYEVPEKNASPVHYHGSRSNLEIDRENTRGVAATDHSEPANNESLVDDDSFKASSTGMLADNPDRFDLSGKVTFHHHFALETRIAELNGVWRLEMPVLSVTTNRKLCRVGVLPCGYADRSHHSLGILLRSWTSGNRFERVSPGQGTFTFLVDFNAMYTARAVQLWVDNSWWVARSRDPDRIQGHLSRSIFVRIKVNPERYEFASALPSTACWNAQDSVLQLHDRMGGGTDIDRVTITFRYSTGSYINIALRLPTRLNAHSVQVDNVSRDRIQIFAGHVREQDRDDWLEQRLDPELWDASNHTPAWSIGASIRTHRVFNQLISVLEIGDVQGLMDKALFSGTQRGAEKGEAYVQYLLEERKGLLEAVNGTKILRGSEYDILMENVNFRSRSTGIRWWYKGPSRNRSRQES